MVGITIMIMSVPSVMVAGPTIPLELNKITEREGLPELLPIGLVLCKIITHVSRLCLLLGYGPHVRS